MPILVAAPEAVVVALAALIVGWAATALFRPMLVQLFAFIPYWGASAAAWADRIIGRMLAGASAWVEAAVSPLAAVIATPAAKADHLWAEAERVLAAAADAMATMPTRVAASVDQSLLTPLRQRVVSLAQGLAAEAAARQQAVAAAEQQAESAARTQIERAAMSMDASLRAQMQSVANTLTAAVGAAAAAAGHADRDAQDAAAQAQATAQALGSLARQVGDLSPSAVDGAIAAAGHAWRELLDQRVGRVAGDVAGLGAALSGVQATANTTAREWTRWRDDCGRQLCSGVLPQLQSLMALRQGVGMAEMIAIVAALATDPTASARSVSGALGSSVESVVTWVREVNARG